MSSRPRFADLAAKALAASTEEAVPVAKDDRERAIALIADALQRRRVVRARRRWAAMALVGAAACATLATGLSWHRGVSTRNEHATAAQAIPATVVSSSPAREASVLAWSLTGDVSVTLNGRTAPLEESQSMANGDRVDVREGARAALILATGTRLTVEGSSDVTVVEGGPTQVFSLVGAARADVAKLGAGERFIIRTVDAEVEVRGTSFRVSTVASDPTCGGGNTTRVTVFEGVVAVRARGVVDAVGAGESWPRGCNGRPNVPSPAARPITPASALSASRPRGHELPAPIAPTASAAIESARSELTAQNDVFAEGMAAKRRGDAAAAIAAYERLLARYPKSTLAESAAAERMKLLVQVDRARAAIAAKEYLERYPTGFARADAERIVSASR